MRLALGSGLGSSEAFVENPTVLVPFQYTARTNWELNIA